MDNNNYTSPNQSDGMDMYTPPVKQPKQKKSKALLPALIIVSVFLVFAVIFAGIQSVYIFKLNTGKIGNKAQTTEQTTKATEKTEESKNDDTEKLDTKSADPWFSIDDAASVNKEGGKTKLSTVDIANKVSPSTVSIYIKGDYNKKSVTISSGSGFIISKDGYVVTNAHVVDDVKDNGYEVEVGVPGMDEHVPAKIVGMDKQTDIAVVKLLKGDNYTPVTLGDSDKLVPGELVVAIGNALGTLDGTVTVGVISAVNREIANEGYTLKVLQTDASINEGNSGGPLINSYGEVIGVTNAKMVTQSSEGLGFAIPISKVRSVIESLINNGVVKDRPYLGITVQSQQAEAYFGSEDGVYVRAYTKKGPGDEAGIQIGDKIVSMDGVAIKQSNDIIDVRDSHKVGDVIKVVVERDGKETELSLKIGDSADFVDSETVSEGKSSTQLPNGNGNNGNNGNNGQGGNGYNFDEDDIRDFFERYRNGQGGNNNGNNNGNGNNNNNGNSGNNNGNGTFDYWDFFGNN
ncbi:MAG: trypsin-like peptidase domain-containing protein [Clostridiales bacterium]|nr:trypsin-like peptidase domain-containing protein [Clostridiales bacterium]